MWERLGESLYTDLGCHEEVVWPEVDKLLPDVGAVVGVGVVGVHVLDGVEYADRVEGVVVLQPHFSVTIQAAKKIQNVL